jgi:cleavage and polyadenylation specificity factor subunit 1
LYEDEEVSDNILALRFSRIRHSHIGRDYGEGTQETTFDFGESPSKAALIPFSNISGYSGVFMSGPHPAWIIYTNRKFVRLHPMSFDGEVVCFTPFHNVHCTEGFVYYNKKVHVRLFPIAAICLISSVAKGSAAYLPAVQAVQLRVRMAGQKGNH